MTLDDIYKEIKNAESFVILTHENPDGDAIGSATAMAMVLKNMGKSIVDIYLKEYPEIYKFVPGTELIKSEAQKTNYDMAIVLDCSSLERVNVLYRDLFENALIKVQIDHHNKNAMFADYNIVNPVSPACTQILSSSFDYLGIEITKEIATSIITGIITDTCGFSTKETSADSFEFASTALNMGVNVSKVYRDAFNKISKPRFEIQKLAQNRLEFLENGKIAYTYITKEDEKNIGTQNGDLATIVEIGKNIEGVEVSVFIYEKEDGSFKASIRSNEYIDSSAVCLSLGGGGHLRAGGVILHMSLEEAKDMIIKEIKKYI